jgi:phytol kinase
MQFNNFLAKRNLISSSTSRKFIHIGTGPIFILCWLLFPDHPFSKYLAAFVPLLIVVQLVFVGLGVIKDDSTIKAMARTGGRRELLKGPLLYGIVFVILTIFNWKSIYAVISLMILCGGDGLADLIGSKFSSRSIPWNHKKTILGSFSMFLGGFILSALLILIYKSVGYFNFSWNQILFSLGLISIVATLIESATPSEYDNLTVPFASMILSLLLL